MNSSKALKLLAYVKRTAGGGNAVQVELYVLGGSRPL